MPAERDRARLESSRLFPCQPKDLRGDRRHVIHEAVISPGNLEEPGSLCQPSGALPTTPVLTDVVEGDALVTVADDDGDGRGRRVEIVFETGHLLEETSVDGLIPFLRVVKEGERVAGRKLLDPSPSESDRRRDEYERNGSLAPGDSERDDGAERTSDDHRRLVPLRLTRRGTDHGIEIEPAKRRQIEIGRVDLESAAPENLPQSRDLPPVRRGSETVQVEDRLHVKSKNRRRPPLK